MSVTISRTGLATILAEAAASADEVCGLLLGEADAIRRVVACRNVAARPAVRFEIDPAALIAAHRAARGGGEQVIGHYHSHPSGRAVPSPRDAADAAADDALWVIVAGGEATAWRAVPAGQVEGRFDPVALAVSPCVRAPASPEGPPM